MRGRGRVDPPREPNWGARLDHRRAPEGGSLGRVEGNEGGGQRHPRRAGDDRPPEGQAERWADEAYRNGEVLEVAQEPQRRLVPNLAVPLVVRDPVDRARLDPVDAGPLRAYRRLVLSSHGKLFSCPKNAACA